MRRFISVDDCGVRINPMIVEGQIHGRPRRGRRDRADAADRVRRAGQLPERLVHGLPGADVDGGPGLGARRDGHAVAAPPDRRQGRRRVVERRLAAGDRQRGGRRARAVRRHATSTCRSRRRACGRRCRRARRSRRSEPGARELAEARRRVRRGDRRALRLADERAARRPRASCSATGRSRGSSAARARTRPCACRRCACWRPASRCCCGSCPGEDDGPATRRARSSVANPCLSGGALEIFLEPHLPAPRVAVAGESPVARALVDARAAAGLRRAPATGGRARRLRGRRRLARARRRGGAARGARGRRAVRRAGRVAAARRGGARRAARGRAWTRSGSRRVHTPAGLDIGARTPAGDRARRSSPRSCAAARAGRPGAVAGGRPPGRGPPPAAEPHCRELLPTGRRREPFVTGLVLAAGGSRAARAAQAAAALPRRDAARPHARHGARVRLRPARRRARRLGAGRARARST